MRSSLARVYEPPDDLHAVASDGDRAFVSIRRGSRILVFLI